MKQGTVRILGAAALGAAFTIVAAGAAAAAPADTVRTLPAELNKTLPVGEASALGEGQSTPGSATDALLPAAQQENGGLPAAGPLDGLLGGQGGGPQELLGGLLGGLPVGGLLG
ncbi:hypothetical protein [Streptomyces sp. TP-A0874]|uniref:hypothetical protein n=1 Tax=Streptomyces sp. TP-A0874 TaxID=549819 RepID=UPI0008537D98|nr:hypothetical protein [Streptomyces sp. TP-A0874]